MSWDNRIREYHAPFDIIVTVKPEFVPIADLFDDSIDPDTGQSYYDVDYMNRQVELGEAEWLMVKVECRLNGQEIGSSALGGAFLTEDYDLKSFVYDNGMIDDAKAEAITWLKESKEVFDDVA
tara:strand:+ start:286 stop:654 length:369 start_codon:yes stop_codon:yes gene_type:complete